MMLFLIMLFTDLFMVGICFSVYGKATLYHDHMLLGVHIPGDKLETPSVTALIASYKKQNRHFYLIHLILGAAVSLLAFWYTSILIICWSIWLVAFFYGIFSDLYRTHRMLYSLKTENGWYDDLEEPVTAAADTSVSAPTRRLTPPLWLQFLPLLLFLIPVLFPSIREQIFRHPEMQLPLVCATVVGLFFPCMAATILHSGNKIYSEHSEINLQLNTLEKRTWYFCLLLSGLCNAFSFLVLLWQTAYQPFSGILPFSVIAALPVIVLPICIWRLHVKKKAILATDTAPLYVDDDYFWRNGWYDNPNDPRVLVQNRYSSMNYTFNLGRPIGKVLTYGICLAVGALFLWMFLLFLKMDFTPIRLTITGENVSITSGYTDADFQLRDIEEIHLLDQLPAESFTKTNGSADNRMLLGIFWGSQTGNCRMYVTLRESPVLEIRVPEYTVFLNSTTPGQTQAWYEELLAARYVFTFSD